MLHLSLIHISTNSALIFIDHQPQMSFGVANIDRQTLKNNTVALAKAGKIFNVPVIYTSVETKSFSGYIWPELLAVHPDVKPIERTPMTVSYTHLDVYKRQGPRVCRWRSKVWPG